MIQRDRLQHALQGETITPPPAAPLYLGLYLESRRRKVLAQVYAEMAEGEGHLRLTFADELAALVEAQERTMSVFKSPPAWLPVDLGPSRASVEGAKVVLSPGKCLRYPPGGGKPTDYLALYDNRIGDVWETSGELPGVADITSTSASTVEDQVEDYVGAGCCELPWRLVSHFRNRFVPAGQIGAPFWSCYTRLGFAGMMRALRERPELIEAVCAAGLAEALVYAGALKRSGLDCIFVEECLSSSDLISAEDYRRFALPPTRDLLTALKNLGFDVVYYYCGGIEGRLEHLAALPADALAFEESRKGFKIDLARVRREIGPDKVLFGNTAAVLLRDRSETEIAADVQRQFAEAGPRFVVSMGSPATPDTPPDKLDMLVRASERLAK